MSTSLVRIDQEIRRNIINTVLFDLALFLFITAIIIGYILFFVNRPIKRLLQGTLEIGGKGPKTNHPHTNRR